MATARPCITKKDREEFEKVFLFEPGLETSSSNVQARVLEREGVRNELDRLQYICEQQERIGPSSAWRRSEEGRRILDLKSRHALFRAEKLARLFGLHPEQAPWKDRFSSAS